ncbi:MAG: hypothetical protein KJ936_02245 [Proteobacteria bacterium]|nr:hypothetical protein [Pseudomonadota bacterium]
MQRSGELIAGLFDDDLQTSDTDSYAGSGFSGFASESASVRDNEPSHGGTPSNCEEMAG